MKISLYYCPLCEKTRVDRLLPMVWKCKECKIIFELTKHVYISSAEKEKATIDYTFTLTDVSEDDRRRNKDDIIDPRRPT